MLRRGRITSALALALALGLGCGGGPVHSEIAATAAKRDALATSDALEALIAEGRDTPADRERAYEVVTSAPEEATAGYAFARAAVTGRLVEQHGLTKAPLVKEIERFARQSQTLDPSFRDGAATRMLGTLYVLAPGALLEHGDSEEGLRILEKLTAARPDSVENRLRLAEAYVALGDPAPARAHLCAAVAKKSTLRKDEQRLLERLLVDAKPVACP